MGNHKKLPASYLRGMYHLLRRILFSFSAESAHHISMKLLASAVKIPSIKTAIRKMVGGDAIAPVRVFDLVFPNRIGLAAGFDKNAQYLQALEALGFGFVEIGTVTPKPQAGNEKPRLFRLPKDKALINRMGFNNDGADVISERLKNYQQTRTIPSGYPPMLIGGNIGKNKTTPNDDAWKDYEYCFNALHDCVDFFVVNVSSPNTPGLRELQDKDSLKNILVRLQDLNRNYETKRPILLKIAPDLSLAQIDDVIQLAEEIQLDGIVATNTTVSRDMLKTNADVVAKMGNGGLSGAPLKNRSTEIIKYIHQKTNGRIPIVGSGGIFSSADAEEKTAAGASLLEVYTGFIFEGPGIVKSLLRHS